MAKAARTLLTSELALIVDGPLTPVPWRLATRFQDPDVEASQPRVKNGFILRLKLSAFDSKLHQTSPSQINLDRQIILQFIVYSEEIICQLRA